MTVYSLSFVKLLGVLLVSSWQILSTAFLTQEKCQVKKTGNNDIN